MLTDSTLTDEELINILETRIPDLLDRHPELQRRIYAAFLDVFARREEVAAIMNELRDLHGEFHQFRQETNQRFEQVDRRFEQVDKRFEQVDKRFEQVTAEIQTLRQETNQRFEQVDKRFEQVDRRFEQVDKRFEQVTAEIQTLRQETNQRFEQVDRKFEQMGKQFEDLRDWVELVVGNLQVRSGRKLEDVVAAALRLALKRPDIRPESIRLRQKIVDAEGRIFPPGRQKEIDLMATDDEYLVFEVKSAAKAEDVDYFADKVELVRILNQDKKVHGVFITLAPEPEVQQRCKERGIELAR